MIDHAAVELELVRDGSPLVEFAADLRLLRTKAATPSYRDMRQCPDRDHRGRGRVGARFAA
jgi:hypothetical protein